MSENLYGKIEFLLLFLAGSLIFSLSFAIVAHYTVGQDICQLAEGLEATGPDAAQIISPESSCPGLLERWASALTTPLTYQPLFWTVTIFGGLLSTGIYWYREKGK